MENILKNLFFGSLIFICLYRVAFFSPEFVPGLLIGIIGILFMLRRKSIIQIIAHNNIRFFIAIVSIIFIYTLMLDIAYSQRLDVSSLRNLFSFRFLMFIILTVSCSYIVELFVANGNKAKLNSALKYAVFIQFAFFIIMFFQPNTKFAIYDIFGMQDSVNLYDHNVTTRGFGVGSELNYTAPIATAIIALLIFNNNLIKSIIFLSQLANSSISLISVIFFLKNRNLIIAYLVILPFILWAIVSNYESLGLSSILPRLDREINSGFSITLNALLYDHIIYGGRSFADFMFGSGLNLLPTAGVYSISSDIGWIIMLNYGGAFLIFLYLLFVIGILLMTPFATHVKIFLFAVMMVMNFKGLFFGPNALLFFIFLVIFNSMKSRKFDAGLIPRLDSSDFVHFQAKPLIGS